MMMPLPDHLHIERLIVRLTGVSFQGLQQSGLSPTPYVHNAVGLPTKSNLHGWLDTLIFFGFSLVQCLPGVYSLDTF